MKNYVFTRELTLGHIKVTVREGDILKLNKDNMVISGKKYDDLRDFDIALKYNWLVEESKVEKKVEITEEIEETEENGKDPFGFKIEVSESQLGNSTPLTDFLKPTVINEKEAFIEEDGIIKSPEDVKKVEEVEKPKSKFGLEVKKQQEVETSIPLSDFNKSVKKEVKVEEKVVEGKIEEKKVTPKKTNAKKSTSKKSKKTTKKRS